mmetsp:Transcript_70551/g.188302  ORF Transcript_70551/g.188302 Transcript_70551/m.188302 type:complete len:124 (-) Transcript_70551:508-879(-)
MKKTSYSKKSSESAPQIREENAKGWGLSTLDFRIGIVYKHLPLDYESALQSYDTVQVSFLSERHTAGSHFSIAQGGPMMECNIGWCLLNGVGCTQDYKKAIEWFTKAASFGAQSSAGSFYNMV